MRRIVAATAIAATALGLSACGGGPADLTQDKAKSVLLDAGDLPDGGWSAGSVDTDKPKDDSTSDELLKNAKDVSQECKDAMKAMEDVTPKDPKAHAKRTYSKGSGSTKDEVEISLNTYDKAKDAPGKIKKVSDVCKSLKLSESGMDIELKMDSPSLKTDGSQGLTMSMDLLGQKMSLVMAVAPEGNNLVAVTSQGSDKDKVVKVVDEVLTKQADKVKKAG